MRGIKDWCVHSGICTIIYVCNCEESSVNAISPLLSNGSETEKWQCLSCSTYIHKALQLYHMHPTSYSLTTGDALPLLEEIDDGGQIYMGLTSLDELSDVDSYSSKKQPAAQLIWQWVYQKSAETAQNVWSCTRVLVIWKQNLMHHL